MTKLLILAALATLPVGQPVFAQTAPAERSAVVRHSDLDLKTERGTKTLERRLWRAAVEVCGTASDADLTGKNDMRACRRETMAIASAQADIVVASAARGEPIRVSSIAR